MAKKAHAPRPGAGRRDAATSKARGYLRMRVRDQERTLAVGAIPIKERLVVRKATGYPVEKFLDTEAFGLDSLMVLWWLAGRAAGNPFLTLDEAAADLDDITEDDLDVTEVTPDDEPIDGDDPES